MQIYFQIPSITSIPGLQKIQALKSNLDRYSTGEGPFTLSQLHSILPSPSKINSQDVGEILDRITLLTTEDKGGLPRIIHLDPTASLYSSLQGCQAWNFSQGDGNENTFIFQINRVSPKGQKITSNMTYPGALNLQKCQPSKGQKTGTHHFLKAVVVHKGSSVNRGHYVVYIQPGNSRNWALFDDQTVSWVQEEEALHQEAALLIYSRQLPPTLFGESKGNQQIMDTGPPKTMTSHQQHRRDSSGTMPPGQDEEHLTHPASPQPTQIGPERSQPKSIPEGTPRTMEITDQAGRQRGLQRFQEALKKKLTKSSTEWTSLSTITQWLSGQNRQRPCQSLSELDLHQIQTWIGQEQDITSYIKSRDFILVKQTTNGIFLALRTSTTPTAHLAKQPPQAKEPREEGRRVVMPPPTDLPTTKKVSSSTAN
jgi:hypothetical protein